MDKKNVNCPFCGYEKQIGADCPKCGRGGVILKVEDVAAGCRYHKPLSEHDSFDSAYEAACKLFDDGAWDDFLIDDGGHLTSLPGYRLVKETCPKCGKEARPFEMYGTRDYQCKADTAFQNYQETGITRYDTARRNNEDMAEALRMAASAKEDHDRMIHLRGVLSQLAWRAAEANRASEEDRPRKMQAVLGELLSAARMQGLIRDEGGDFK